MISLLFECAETEREGLIAELYSRGTLGIVERDVSGERIALQAFFEEPIELGGLQSWFVEEEAAEERDWERETKESYPPLLIGNRFFLAPEWTCEPTPPGRLRLPTHPGRVCGTGYHEATQLCLEAMEDLIHPGATFVDIGVGSGLLCVAASQLGATRLIGCDIDEEAVQRAEENSRKDGVTIQLFAGSTQALPSNLADYLVANISAAAHLELAREYARLLHKNGVALLSGFEEYEEEAVRHAANDAGLQYAGRHERHRWVCAVVRR